MFLAVPCWSKVPVWFMCCQPYLVLFSAYFSIHCMEFPETLRSVILFIIFTSLTGECILGTSQSCQSETNFVSFKMYIKRIEWGIFLLYLLISVNIIILLRNIYVVCIAVITSLLDNISQWLYYNYSLSFLTLFGWFFFSLGLLQ
jgi:hypothetical protein